MDDYAMSAAIFTTQQQALEEIAGAAEYRSAIETLPEEVRRVVQTQMGVGWVPLSVAESTVEAVAARLDPTPAVLQREVAMATVSRALRGVWRTLVSRLVSPFALMARGTIWRRVYNRGEIHVDRSKPGHAIVTIAEAPDAPEFMLRGVAFAIEGLMSHYNRRAIRVTWSRTPDGAVYEVRSLVREELRAPAG